MSEEKQNNEEELVVEDVQEEDLLENQELAEQDNPEEVTEESQERLSQSVLNILLGESKNKNEEDEDEDDSEDDSEDEDEDEVEEATKKESEDEEDDSEDEEDDEVEEATKKESDEEEDEEDDDEVEEATKKESENGFEKVGDEEEYEESENSFEKVGKEKKVKAKMESVQTKAGILGQSFNLLRDMKVHDLKKVFEEIKTEDQEVPSGKSNLVNSIYENLKELNKDDLVTCYESIQGILQIDREELEEQDAFASDLKVLADSDSNLTEEFKSKASTLFEAAVINRVNTIKEKLENEYQEALSCEIEYIRESVVERIDSYTDYIVEEWISDNQEMVDNKLRTQIAEDFMQKLHNLFVESYIEVPASKEDLVDSLAEDVESLKEELTSVTESRDNTLLELNSLKKERIVSESIKDMSSTDSEKLKSLIEDLEYSNFDVLEEKIKIIKESLFNGEKTEDETIEENSLNGDSKIIVEGEGDATANLSPDMKKYLSALSKLSK